MPFGDLRRAVVAITDPRAARSEHGTLTLMTLAPRIANLLECREARSPYVVPACTLTRAEAALLHVRDEDDLFGGVVPHAFVATKVISHPVPPWCSEHPEGWSDALGVALEDHVLPGYSVFNHEDALRAGTFLLGDGPVRVKPADGIGGGGQCVIDSAPALQDLLAGIDVSQLGEHGIVIERNLVQETTYSIGELVLGGMRAAYWGIQRQSRNHAGRPVYGGSDLYVVRGALGDLLPKAPDEDVRQAIGHAMRYEAAVFAAYPDTFASRRNYDVAIGHDACGRPWCGVLEQSWRIGGASPAEIAALEAFASDSQRHEVHVSTHEVYELADLPDGAQLHYRGTDPVEGCLTKYSRVHADGYPSR